MITLFNRKQDCCGCTACKSICPNQAITMQTDDEGFFYPSIDESLCIECGLCKEVCAFQIGYETFHNLRSLEIYALKHKSDEVRMSSSSGGAFSAISDFVLSEYGLIYGVAYDEIFHVIHKRAENEVERNRFRGSKYVQSDMEGVFIQIRDDLKNGKLVLFTGTPCQVAGLNSGLTRSVTRTDKLITVDIICHGVPSSLLWKDYIKFIQSKYRSKLKSYTFRSKEKGWHGYNVRAVFENGKAKISTTDVMIYPRIFCSDMAIRPSCYHCKFSNLNRPSDITIGDFWGIEKSLPDFEDEKGVSLMLINTSKGQAVFEQIKENICCEKSNTIDCLQHNLELPTKCPSGRDQFWNDYYENGFRYVAVKYAGYGFVARTKSCIIRMLRHLELLSFAKKVLKR